MLYEGYKDHEDEISSERSEEDHSDEHRNPNEEDKQPLDRVFFHFTPPNFLSLPA